MPMSQMTIEEQLINEKAIEWARANKKRIAKELTNTQLILPEQRPVSVFMAGSPGAGKTEVSKALVSTLGGRVLRIDPDEFRDFIPGYMGAHSWLFQGAISVLTGKVIDLALEQSQSFLLDGTLSNLVNASSNVDRSLRKKRDVLIIYVYQAPTQAWEFVQAREKVEGRRIPADRFVEQLFGARDVVNELKATHGNQIQVDVIYKNIDGRNRRYEANVPNLNQSDLISYTKEYVSNLVSL
jgi:UDP-N-acetylglucosamine kinase